MSIHNFKQNQVANEANKQKLEAEVKKLQAVEKVNTSFETLAKEAQTMLKKLEISAQLKPTWSSLDFQTLSQEVSECFQTQSINFSLKILQELRSAIEADKKSGTSSSLMLKVEQLVKLEANKSDTCGTVQKMLKFSNEK